LIEIYQARFYEQVAMSWQRISVCSGLPAFLFYGAESLKRISGAG
jgi:hypothetical protein